MIDNPAREIKNHFWNSREVDFAPFEFRSSTVEDLSQLGVAGLRGDFLLVEPVEGPGEQADQQQGHEG